MRNYIVLRKESGYGLGLGGHEASDSAQIEVTELPSFKDEVDLFRDPEVIGFSPEIPISLVQPMESTAPGSKAVQDNATWGIHLIGASDSELDGSGVKVGVIDTGIDIEHSAFRGMNLTEVDYTGEGNGDKNGHGTHVAATIFGRDVNGTRIGIARGITEAYIAKVIGKNAGTASLVRAILDAVDAKCRVLNMSLGFDFTKTVKMIQAINDLPIEIATARALYEYRQNIRVFDKLGEFINARVGEVVMIAAAGNESKRVEDPNCEVPAAPPSEAEGFVSVGAVGLTPTEELTVTYFSNTGCTLCAPGENILSAYAGQKNGLKRLDGTSMAAPHVSGIAAMLFQQRSEDQIPGFFRTRAKLLNTLIASTTKQRLKAGYNPVQVGHGIVKLSN